jgi:hypothetical protein
MYINRSKTSWSPLASGRQSAPSLTPMARGPSAASADAAVLPCVESAIATS